MDDINGEDIWTLGKQKIKLQFLLKKEKLPLSLGSVQVFLGSERTPKFEGNFRVE